MKKGRKTIILIGGAPVTGKSSLADKLLSDLSIPWISTDVIRSQMREVVNKEDFPGLLIFDNATVKMARDILENRTPKEIVDLANEESVDVWKGVEGLMNKDADWAWLEKYIVGGAKFDSLAIEGVAILPKFVASLRTESDIKPIFIVDHDSQRIKERIFRRGLWDDADKYPDDLKSKEVLWVVEFNKYIKKEAVKYNYPIVEFKSDNSYFREIKELVK